MTIILILVAGGTASGKTTLASKLARELGEENCTLLSEDWFYHDHPGMTAEQLRDLNYDHMDAIDWGLMGDQLNRLLVGETQYMPRYDFKTHRRHAPSDWVKTSPQGIIILEGIRILAHPGVRSRAKFRFFVDTDADERVLRRIIRDTEERGRELNDVIRQWRETVKPMHFMFCEPSKRFADLIVLNGGESEAVNRFLKAGIHAALNGG
ncbi:uridine kinase [Patescibacteria group bacterium]|nr:uridine kinase [Patescibacteria group bacterium]MBU1613060.1 uridine kinase [Patescibacteria group bacterium]